MLALQATNDALALCSQATAHLEPYLGPQCYPQLRDDVRYRANEPKATSGADDVPTLPAAREQLRCWLQCDDCKRWRLVERKSFRAVDPDSFASADENVDGDGRPTNWGRWVEEAPKRFDVFKQRRELRLAVASGERHVDEGAREGEPDDGSCTRGGSVALACNAIFVDNSDAGASSSGSESRATSDRGSGDEMLRARVGDGEDSFRNVLRRIGSKGGGLTLAEAVELERLDKTCVANATRDVNKRELPKVAFRCDMLMARGAGAEDDSAWRCMSCADPCDFDALVQSDFGFFDGAGSVLWQPGDVVAVWDADENAMSPLAAERFQRFAIVIAAQAAGADRTKLVEQWPDVRNKERNLPLSRDLLRRSRR